LIITTHFLTHIFQHTLFDSLKFTWSHQIRWVPYQFGGTYVDFNQSKECVRRCVASVSLWMKHMHFQSMCIQMTLI